MRIIKKDDWHEGIFFNWTISKGFPKSLKLTQEIEMGLGVVG